MNPVARARSNPLVARAIHFKQTHPKEVSRFFKFATVGAIGMILDLITLNLLVKVAGWHLIAANSVSFTLAVISNFTWNRLWTFPESKERPVTKQLPQFALVSTLGLALNNLILWAGFNVLTQFLPDPFDYNLAKIIAIGVILFWNFGINRLWTYRGL